MPGAGDHRAGRGGPFLGQLLGKQFAAPGAAVAMQRRGLRGGSLADGFLAASSALYAASVARQISRKLADPALQRRLSDKLARHPDWGVLVVIGYYRQETATGLQVSNLAVWDGSAAPFAWMAIRREQTAHSLRPAPPTAGWTYETDFLWISPGAVRVRRATEDEGPRDVCVGGEFLFDRLRGLGAR